MKTETKFILTTEEKQAIKTTVQTVTCSCECQEHNPCPFLMENGGCIIEALEEILDNQE
jgi:hypothetical protein